MTTPVILKRIDFLLMKGNECLTTRRIAEGVVNDGLFIGFRSASLSFLLNIFGERHPYYKEFDNTVRNSYCYDVESGTNILNSAKEEVEQGWLNSFKQLIAAEIFSDFLEMSKYLLDEGYKDPSAVMIGSVLEEHLRYLCNKNSIDTFTTKGNDVVPKKADLMNGELYKGNVYGAIELKLVTSWLGIRNSAAHGKYSDYKKEQVDTMYTGVLNFISQTK